jgi:hypothetical protein
MKLFNHIRAEQRPDNRTENVLRRLEMLVERLEEVAEGLEQQATDKKER